MTNGLKTGKIDCLAFADSFLASYDKLRKIFYGFDKTPFKKWFSS